VSALKIGISYFLFLGGLVEAAALIILLAAFSGLMQRRQRQEEPPDTDRAAHEYEERQEDIHDPHVRALAGRIHAVSHQLYAQREQAKRQDNDRATRETVTIIALFIAAAFAFGSDVIFYAQLGEMQTSDQPSVGISNIVHVSDANAVIATVSNRGKTTAKNARIKIVGGGERDTSPQLPLNKICDEDCNIRGLDMLPGIPVAVRVPPLGKPSVPTGSPLWIARRIDYIEFNGTTHTTAICIVLLPPYGVMKTCPIDGTNYSN
jgi:hypothetical protein